MKFTAFFSRAMIVLAATPMQMAAFTLSPLTPTVVFASTSLPTIKVSTLWERATVEPSFLISQQSRTQRIQFAPNAVSAVVEGSVVRGTRNIYLLRARRGQTMKLNITSLEQNAVFDIQSPNGRFLKQEGTSWRGVLPVTGDYSVIVGGTRGNATYKVDVTIE
ncbi:MAG TPA: hypothetical protein DCE56_31165 [Cyanobacteria bacterium UBA8553]|nr:hypothetical protein [Cyanobacteria bacterium UBA8553]HAJ59861.1 hypothetical protein [Cyanobacteria bacterium UBA8543]